MAGKQKYKKRGGGSGNTGESTFETSEKTVEVPEIGGIMDQIDTSLHETRNVVVKEKKVKKEKVRSGGCFSSYED